MKQTVQQVERRLSKYGKYNCQHAYTRKQEGYVNAAIAEEIGSTWQEVSTMVQAWENYLKLKEEETEANPMLHRIGSQPADFAQAILDKGATTPVEVVHIAHWLAKKKNSGFSLSRMVYLEGEECERDVFFDTQVLPTLNVGWIDHCLRKIYPMVWVIGMTKEEIEEACEYFG